jgi:hypothetical protein
MGEKTRMFVKTRKGKARPRWVRSGCHKHVRCMSAYRSKPDLGVGYGYVGLVP